MTAPFRRLYVLVMSLFFAPWSQAVTRDVKAYGAAGDGITDDAAAINAAIAALQSGDELFFPCGNYKASSALTPITANNVIVDGQTGCGSGAVKIYSTASGALTAILQIGNGGLGNSSPLT